MSTNVYTKLLIFLNYFVFIKKNAKEKNLGIRQRGFRILLHKIYIGSIVNLVINFFPENHSCITDL